jgi:hypothetical protein
MHNLVIIVFLVLLFASLAGSTGIGGGGFFTPVLLIVGILTPHEAIPLSKAIILGVATGAVLLNIRNKKVMYKFAFLMEPFTIAGTLIGVQLNMFLPGTILLVLLVVVLSLTGLKTLYSAKEKRHHILNGDDCSQVPESSAETEKSAATCEPKSFRQKCLGIVGALCAGILAGSVGIGGGLLKVPLMLELGLAAEFAAGTGSLMVLFTSLSTVTQFIIFQRLGLLVALAFFMIGFLGSLIGSYCSRFLSEGYKLQIVLAGLILLSTGMISMQWVFVAA